MILTEKMEYLSAIILHRDADIVTKALLDLGVVDFSVTAQTPDNLHMTKYSSGNQHSKMQELAKRCENFLDMVDLPLPRMDHIDVTSELPSLDVQGAENFINELAISINQFREQQRQNQRRISELQIMQKRLVNEEQAQSLMGYTGTLSRSMQLASSVNWKAILPLLSRWITLIRLRCNCFLINRIMQKFVRLQVVID